MERGPYGSRLGLFQPVVDVHLHVTMWSVQLVRISQLSKLGLSAVVAYTFCAQTSGELGSGTALGCLLFMKIICEASSSLRLPKCSLTTSEGAD